LAVPENVLAEGANYRVALEGTLARVTVWRAPDLTTDAAADELARAAERLRDRLGSASAALFDIRHAPPIAGPRTAAVVSGIYSAFAARKRKVAVVCTPEHALQELQQRRLLSESAPEHGAIFTTLAEAERWLAEP
jgi:hypothetical protein